MDRVFVAEDNPSFQRIEERCLHCGVCLNTCKKQNNLPDKACLNCGACILTCPVGALVPRYNYKEVLANINDQEKFVIISVSPAVRVAIGDEFGFAKGEFLEKKLVGVLKSLGFHYVFDTTFGADLTTIEEATELIERIEKKQNLPLFSSCCPSWVLNMEMNHKEDLKHLSSCKSPIGMQSSMIKNYFAKLKAIEKENIITVALAPCVSKKSEIKRKGFEDTDYVLTTSELAMLIREKGLDFKNVAEAEFDHILGKGSGGGVIFGSSGGVCESVLRTAYFLLNNEKAPQDFFNLESLRTNDPIKTAEIDLKKFKIKVAVINGISEVNKVYSSLKDYDFVEVMTCSGGCVGGGGQPLVRTAEMPEYIKARRANLYQDDANLTKKSSYENLDIQKIYQDYLKYPGSDKALDLLHVKYDVKELVNNK